ncbi:MAG: hypothetical protein GQ522_05100, partial [Deltaproteobacteria bacterium]|nr:hypothetical protein [Deltaproteobacteria bacterium]
MMEKQSDKSIFEYWEIFSRRKWWVIIPAIIGTVIAAIYSYTLPPYYRSTTLILVEQQKVPEAYVMPTDVTPLAKRLSTIQQQIMSRTRLEQIIMDLNLDNESEPTNPISRVIGKVRPHTRNTPGKEEIVERMREAINVEVIEGSSREGAYAFRVSYEGRDPKTTMQVTSTLASMFIEENLKIREQYAEGTTEFLSSELDKAKKALEEQERAVRSFKEAHMGALPEQLDANLRTLDRLQMELQSVNDSLRNAKDRSALLEEQLGLGSAQSASIANPVQEELLRLRQDLVQLRTIFKENYPDVVIARSRINELEKELANRSATGGQGSENPEEIDPAIQSSRLYGDMMSVKSQI